MSGLAAVLAHRKEAGIYRWHGHFKDEDVRHTVEHAGWDFGHVDGWLGESEADFHAALAASLGFPDWYRSTKPTSWVLWPPMHDPVTMAVDSHSAGPRTRPESQIASRAEMSANCAKRSM